MARTPKQLQPLDLAIAQVAQALVKDSGLTYRVLAERAGMGLNRIGTILRAEEPPTTIGELDRIARALGTTASAILRDAERILAGERAGGLD